MTSQNHPTLAGQTGLFVFRFLDLSQLDHCSAHRLWRQIPACSITRFRFVVNAVGRQIAACHNAGHRSLDNSMMLRVVMHFHVHNRIPVVLVSQPQCIDVSVPCHHTLKIRDTLGHWRSTSSTVMSIQCPAGPLPLAKHLDVPKSTPSASDDVDVRQLV